MLKLYLSSLKLQSQVHIFCLVCQLKRAKEGRICNQSSASSVNGVVKTGEGKCRNFPKPEIASLEKNNKEETQQTTKVFLTHDIIMKVNFSHYRGFRCFYVVFMAPFSRDLV
jgi:hypothetical protein